MLVAIHQPNFIPRLKVLAKLLAVDAFVILDDVQFAHREWQARTRLGSIDSPLWLTIPVHRPEGQRTRITDVLIADPARAGTRAQNTMQRHYAKSKHWEWLRSYIDQITPFESNLLAQVAARSMICGLRMSGWKGEVVRSSDLGLQAHSRASERLADICHCVGASAYLSGSGGSRYLDLAPFRARGIDVRWQSWEVDAARSGLTLESGGFGFINAVATSGPAVLRDLLVDKGAQVG